MAFKRKHRVRQRTYLLFFCFFACAVILAHFPFWDTAYFWDEAGVFIPTALDLRNGSWISHSTEPVIHPPALSAYLAGFWGVFGYSVMSTRRAMLLVASLGVLAVFLLAIQLCKDVRGAPAFAVVALLTVCPLFYAQSMLAQLDVPALLFTSLAVLFFLQNGIQRCALACVALVLVKETGLVVPLVFGALLMVEKRWRQALWMLPSFAAVGVWIAVLLVKTGHPLGSAGFAEYNFFYALHPARIAAALLRRGYYLFIADFHWVGAAALVYAWRKSTLFQSRSWRVAAILVAAHAVFVSVVGGAVLERYLLPIWPLVLIAMVAATSTLPGKAQLGALAVLFCGFIAGNFINPPYPFAYENNLAFTDFTQLNRVAAEYLEFNYSGSRITTAWPVSVTLKERSLGYTHVQLDIREVLDLRPRRFRGLQWKSDDVLVLYSRTWDPPYSIMRIPAVRGFMRTVYDYQSDATLADVATGQDLRPVARWEKRGQWVEVYARLDGAVAPRAIQVSQLVP